MTPPRPIGQKGVCRVLVPQGPKLNTEKLGRRLQVAIVGLALLACGVLGAPAAAEGGHLPGFSVADQRLAVAKLPEMLRFTFGGIPGAKGSGLPHVGQGPVWFGEVRRPKGTIYAAGNGRSVCESEARLDEVGGGSSCTTPAGAREFGILDVSSCGRGAPRHFRITALVPDGVSAFEVEKADGKIGRTVPVIENTLAFTIGRENIIMRPIGDPTAEGLERSLPLARAARRFHGDGQAGCSFFTFFEDRGAREAARAR
jgi:hypothetical protein